MSKIGSVVPQTYSIVAEAFCGWSAYRLRACVGAIADSVAFGMNG